MISIVEALLSLFPLSFLAYAMSERMIAKHETRVGLKIHWGDFLRQSWVNAILEIKQVAPTWLWLVYALQLSIIFLFQVNVEYLVFIYLALNGFVLVHLARVNPVAVKQIESDRLQIRYSIATAIAALCVFGCFTVSQSTSLPQVHWSVLELLFIVPFQLAGMMLFGEHPFQGMSKRAGWVGSCRFYAWSMLASKLFLGGGFFFIDLHIKSFILYLLCRTLGIYFPKFHQRDLLRIGILYLFPITGLIWLVAMLLFGMIETGAAHV